MTEAPNAQGQNAPTEAPTHPEAQPQAPEGYVPQKDVNKIVGTRAKEAKQVALNELLEKAGAESVDDLLSAYSEFQGIREATETAADRAEKDKARAEERAKAAEERYTNTLREFALRDALRDSGINPERLKGAMRLADMSALEVDKEGTVSGLDEVVEAVKEDSPEWFGSIERPRINAPQTTGTGVERPNGQTPEEQQAQWLLNLLGQ